MSTRDGRVRSVFGFGAAVILAFCPGRLLKEINDWIFNHIFEEDKNLGAFILEAEES